MSNTPVPPFPREPGERALRTGLLLAGIFLLAANMRASLTVVSPLLGDIRSDLQLSSSATSALISLPLLCFAVFSPIVPRLAARRGIERTLGAGLVMLIGGILLRSAPWMPGLWLGTVLVGTAISAINVLLPSLLKRDFPTRIAPLTGAYNALQSGFAALASGFAVPMAALPGWSWRTALGATAAIALIGLAVFLPQLRARQHRPSATEARTPREVVAAEEARPVPLWKQATAWHVTAFMGLQSTVFYALLTWWPSIEVTAGVSPEAAGTHMAMLQLLSIAGNLAAGSLLRRIDARWLIAASTALILGGFLGMMALPQASLAWSLLFGVATGLNIVIALSLFGARTTSHQRAATLSGMAQAVGYPLAAVVPPLLGLVHDATGTWTLVLIIMCAVGLASAFFGFLASRPRSVR